MVGGRNDTSLLADVERYDLTLCTWSTVAPLPKPLRCTTAVSHRGSLYVFGGESATEIVNTAYKSDYISFSREKHKYNVILDLSHYSTSVSSSSWFMTIINVLATPELV